MDEDQKYQLSQKRKLDLLERELRRLDSQISSLQEIRQAMRQVLVSLRCPWRVGDIIEKESLPYNQLEGRYKILDIRWSNHGPFTLKVVQVKDNYLTGLDYYFSPTWDEPWDHPDDYRKIPYSDSYKE